MSRLAFLTFLLLVALVTTLAYHQFRAEWVLFREGETLYKQGDVTGCQKAFTQALHRGLRAEPFLYQYHDALLRTGQATAAVDLIRTAFQSDFSPPLIETLVGQSLSAVPAETLASLAREWVALHPHNRGSRLTAARLYTKLGRFADAEREYRTILGETMP